MGEQLEIKVIRRSDKVLYPVLLRGHVPVVLANLWIDELSMSARLNTLKGYLHDVLQLYRWAEQADICLHQSFATLKGLPPALLKSAVTFMTSKNDGERVAQNSSDRKAQALRSFFSFGFDYFLAKGKLNLIEQRQAIRNRDAILKRTTKLFRLRSHRVGYVKHSTPLTKSQLEALEQTFRPDSSQNPFCSEMLRVRNYCIWRVMLATGARRAEIVLLELDDLKLGFAPTITIRQPTQSATYRRRDGANLKTQERVVPITTELAELLADYIQDTRIHHVRRDHPSPALFLSTKDGRRLASGTINQTLARVASQVRSGGLKQRVHPHGIRTTFLEDFSRSARDKQGRQTPSFRDELLYLAGWSPSSDMPLTYTRQAISDSLGDLLRSKKHKDSDWESE